MLELQELLDCVLFSESQADRTYYLLKLIEAAEKQVAEIERKRFANGLRKIIPHYNLRERQ